MIPSTTFGKDRLINIKRARTILKNEKEGCCHNNRDTMMIEEAIVIINTVLEYHGND